MEFDVSFDNLLLLTSELEDINGIRDVAVDFHDTPEKKDIPLLEDFLGFQLPKSLMDFYQYTIGIDFTWKYQNQNNNIYTCASGMAQNVLGLVHGLHYTFRSEKRKVGRRHENYLWSEDTQPDLIHYLENQFCILDRISVFRSAFTLVKFIDENTEPELYLYKYPHYLCPLTLTFSEYFEAAYQCRMLEGWQDYFIDRDKCDKQTLNFLEEERPFPSLTKFHEVFPDLKTPLFPEIKDEPKLSYEKSAIEKDYYNRFKENISNLENMISPSNGNVNFKENDEPLTIHTIRKVEAVLGRKLPDSMLAFYCQFNGFNLEWSYKPDGKYKNDTGFCPGSAFQFLGLEQVFGGKNPSGNRLWHDQMWEGIITMEGAYDDKTMAFAKQCRPIILESYTRTVIRFTEEKDEPEIYILVRGKFYRLPLTFEELLEEMLSHMGMTDWQKFLLDKNDFTDREIAFTSGPAVRFIKDTFPNADISKYRDVVTNVDEEVFK